MNDQANSVDERYATTPVTLTSWSRQDTTWMLGLFGTAIGAGTLFLPINAGLGGFWPLMVLAVLAFPMTFFAHRGLTRFVLSGREGSDITDVVEEHFGIRAGALITLLYFFAIFPILLIYSVALTNTPGIDDVPAALSANAGGSAAVPTVGVHGIDAFNRCFGPLGVLHPDTDRHVAMLGMGLARYLASIGVCVS